MLTSSTSTWVAACVNLLIRLMWNTYCRALRSASVKRMRVTAGKGSSLNFASSVSYISTKVDIRYGILTLHVYSFLRIIGDNSFSPRGLLRYLLYYFAGLHIQLSTAGCCQQRQQQYNPKSTTKLHCVWFLSLPIPLLDCPAVVRAR